MPDPDRQQLKEIVKQRRVEEIFDARSSVLELEREVAQATANPGTRVREADVREAYHRLVKQYVRVLEPLLNPPVNDHKSAYWDDIIIGRYERLDGQIYEVIGLADYLTLKPTQEYQIEVDDAPNEDHIDGAQTRLETVADAVPIEIGESAFRAANVSFTELDIDIDRTGGALTEKLIVNQTPGVGPEQ